MPGSLFDNSRVPFGDQIGPRWPQIAIESFELLTTCMFTNLTKDIKAFKVFRVRGRPIQPWKAEEGYQEAPEELPNIKNDKIWTWFLTNCLEFILEPAWDLFLHQKVNRNWTICGIASSASLGSTKGRNNFIARLLERCGAASNIPTKRKRGVGLL